MKLIITLLVTTIMIACSVKVDENGNKILNEAIKVHDPKNVWDKVTLNLHIQEPRVSKPDRFSLVRINNSDNTFELSRNRGIHLSKHIIDSSGRSFVLLDDNLEIDTALVRKYRLQASRNTMYKKFYELMYGLPMSLNGNMIKIIGTSQCIFNQKNCYKLEVQLKEKIISDYWNIYISKMDNHLTGIELIFPSDSTKGDRIFFDQLIEINDLKIPRMRHWYDLNSNEYSGSDIIIKELKG